MSKKENRKIAFDNYLKKRGLEKYSFFISKSYGHRESVFLILTENIAENFEKISSNFHIIRSVHTLVKRTRETMSNPISIKVRNEYKSFSAFGGWDTFNSLEDFRRFSIIKELAGIKK